MLLDVDCGSLKLRFEEQAQRSFSNTSWDEVLLVEGSGRWVEVDRHDHRGGPERYSRLLSPELGYRRFPFDETRPQDQSYNGRSLWGVFAKPAVVNRAEYDVLVTSTGRSWPGRT